MNLRDIIWLEQFVEKIERKHRVETFEVEEILCSRPYALRVEKGRIPGEHLYAAYGQTEAGRYLVVFFIYKGRATALPISARDMTPSERRTYEHKKRR